MLCAGLTLMATLPAASGHVGHRLADDDLRRRVRVLPVAQPAGAHVRRPAERSGGASGIIATSRLVGQSVGAALVALCFGLSARHGPALALALAACFAGGAGLASFSRLLAGRP